MASASWTGNWTFWRLAGGRKSLPLWYEMEEKKCLGTRVFGQEERNGDTMIARRGVEVK